MVYKKKTIDVRFSESTKQIDIVYVTYNIIEIN